MAAIACAAVPVRAVTPWFPLGPYGGSARSFAMDPHNSQHLYLGTATGWIYESVNGGAAWKRLSRVGKRDDLVVKQILLDTVDPKHVIVGAYALDHPDGGLYESHDSGLTWYAQAEMRGQSVRSLAASVSDPKMMVAGTLQGVYRTLDAGAHWRLISPEGSTEIHEVESLAIDPVDPDVIYVGTWHLPWKTLDGGKTWSNIGVKQHFIDDSDVFSIIIDPQKPKTIYASACSGIYKSVDGGGDFAKVQGIPTSARRTRKLAQDPVYPDTVFAGTTEGLYRTLTGGTLWERLTGPDLVVNDIFIDPKNDKHVLLATDRAGVLVSEDGGASFEPSNTGFSTRQVTSFAADRHRAATIYVGVVNDKDSGGVFKSTDGGVRWKQESTALDGRDVFSLASTDEGTLLAGTGHGIFRLTDDAWAQSGALLPTAVAVAVEKKPVRAPSRPAVRKKAKPSAPPKAVIPPPPSILDTSVYALVTAGDAVYAGTAEGLLKGTDDGQTWAAVPTLQMLETRFVAAQKNTVMVANLRRIAVSVDEGNSWEFLTMPEPLTQISAIAVDEMGNLWVGGREGLLVSVDHGATWKTLHNLYVTQVTGLYFDATGHRVLMTASSNTVAFSAHLPDFKVNVWDSGWDLRFVRPVGDHMVGATMYDGIVVQPVMVDTPLVGAN